MPRPLRHAQTLFYYDGPQLIVATDPVETKYLCMLTEQLEDRDRFVCAPISDARLAAFEAGKVDLLQIFRNPEAGDLYEGDAEYSAEDFALAIEFAPQVPEDWYPEEGFFLTPNEAEDTTTTEAKNRDRAVVHLALDPPEAREGLQIEVRHLVNGLRIYQRLVKHAYNKAIRAVDKDSRSRESLASEGNSRMEVFAFSPGSFTVNLQSKSPADWTGHVDIERALIFVDRAVAAANDPEHPTQFLKENRGRFVDAYRDLLGFIKDNDAPLKHEWSIPQYEVARRSVINVEEATELYEILTVQQALTTERVTLVGVVVAVSTVNNSWTLRSDEDRQDYTGKLARGSRIRLNGITVETRRYRFHCEVTHQENPATGKETEERILLSYDKL